MATGLPDSVPAWYTGPSGASRAITSARPPKAAAGKPPPITLPKVTRSGRQPSTAPSRPHHPDRPTRNPVITSSLIEQRTVAATGLGEEPVETRLRRHRAHVAAGGLGDQAGDPVPVRDERLGDGRCVVVRQHQGGGGHRCRYAGRPRDGEGHHARTPPRPAARRRARGSSRRTSPPRRARCTRGPAARPTWWPRCPTRPAAPARPGPWPRSPRPARPPPRSVRRTTCRPRRPG